MATHWTAGAPAWLSTLTEGERSVEGQVTVTWLSETSAEEAKRAIDELAIEDKLYGTAPIGMAMIGRRQRSVLVGRGPERHARMRGENETIWLWFDPETPEQLYAGFGVRFPSLLWLPVGKTIASIAEALAPYLVAESPGVLATAGRARFMVGNEENTFESATSYHEQWETWLDGRTPWGSAFVEDPWAEEIEPGNALRDMFALREHTAQAPNQAESRSMRTIFSRSVLRFEQHAYGAVVAEAQYVAQPMSPVIAEVNRAYDRVLPTDAPLDIAASFLHAGSITLATVDARLETEGPTPYVMLAQCALAPVSLATQEKLLAWVAHPEYGRTALDIGTAFGYRQMAMMRAATTDDPAEAELIFGWLSRAAAPPTPPADDDDSYEGEDE